MFLPPSRYTANEPPTARQDGREGQGRRLGLGCRRHAQGQERLPPRAHVHLQFRRACARNGVPRVPEEGPHPGTVSAGKVLRLRREGTHVNGVSETEDQEAAADGLQFKRGYEAEEIWGLLDYRGVQGVLVPVFFLSFFSLSSLYNTRAADIVTGPRSVGSACICKSSL